MNKQWEHQRLVPAGSLQAVLNAAEEKELRLTYLFLIEQDTLEDGVYRKKEYFYNCVWVRDTLPYEASWNATVLLQEAFTVIDMLRRSCTGIPSRIVERFNRCHETLKELPFIDKNAGRND